jgi:hypothetical protein
VREAYRQETVTFPWQEGDILMLDNMLVAHGRSPFVGSRKIAVGMSETYSYSPTAVGNPCLIAKAKAIPYFSAVETVTTQTIVSLR